MLCLVAGCNLFGQWKLEDSLINKFTSPGIFQNDIRLICINWSYNIYRINNMFYISGFWRGKENQFVKVSLPEEIADNEDLLVIGNNYHLILLITKTHTMWFINLESGDFKKINNIESPISNGHSVAKKIKKDNSILKVVTNDRSSLYLTAEGMVYCGFLPSHVDTTHCEGEVCDIQCGYEHFMLLTDVGRVYTWGNGRRLQLGHGDVSNFESPTEVEALAGIKIIKICAGGWHCLALSEFGDLYAWGWNDTGQLGVQPQPDNVGQGVLKTEGLKSYPLPTFVDLIDENNLEVDLNVKDIACGTRHSAILLEDDTVWTSGYNKYGQLGFPHETYPNVNYFKKSFKCDSSNFNLMCGPWTTVLLAQ